MVSDQVRTRSALAVSSLTYPVGRLDEPDISSGVTGSRRLVSMMEVTRWLQVSNQTVRRWIREHGFPAYKLQRDFRFSRQEIEAWIRKRSGVEQAGDMGQLLTIDQVVVESGVSRVTIYRRLRRSPIPVYKLGPRCVRISAEDVESLA